MAEWIPLLVRQEDYALFARMVAEREVGHPDLVAISSVNVASASGSSEGSDVLFAQHTWSIDALRKFAESSGTYATVDRWARALDVMCEHIGANISSEQVASEAGMPINHWRDAPRKLPGHLAKHYEPGIRAPLIGRGGRELNKDDQVYWTIAPEQAQRWLQVRATTLQPVPSRTEL
jgi:hypothetical protein